MVPAHRVPSGRSPAELGAPVRPSPSPHISGAPRKRSCPPDKDTPPPRRFGRGSVIGPLVTDGMLTRQRNVRPLTRTPCARRDDRRGSSLRVVFQGPPAGSQCFRRRGGPGTGGAIPPRAHHGEEPFDVGLVARHAQPRARLSAGPWTRVSDRPFEWRIAASSARSIVVNSDTWRLSPKRPNS